MIFSRMGCLVMAAVILCSHVELNHRIIQNANVQEQQTEIVVTTENIVSNEQQEKFIADQEIEDRDEEPAEPKEESKMWFTEEDVVDMAKVLYKECGSVKSKTEQACVAWCVLNSVDKYRSSIHDDVRVPNRYAFYESTVVVDEMVELATDVLTRWSREKNGETDVGRVLPKEYLYFCGDNYHNYFRNAFRGDYNVWEYTLKSPYDN